MQKFGEILKQNQKIILGISTACMLGYLLFREKIWGLQQKKKSANLLDVSLQTLISSSSSPQIKKIVITHSPSSKSDFRKKLINHIKSRLMEKGIKVLINCSPQKLMQAGCECFLESMQPNDSEYIEYYYNALKGQFLIEDTISKIQLINEHSQDSIVMICDNNPFDIKLLNSSDSLWHQFLQKYSIQEQRLIDCYDFTIHVIEKDSNKSEDERIEKIWQGTSKYYKIEISEQNSRDSFEQAFDAVLEFLKRSREVPIISA